MRRRDVDDLPAEDVVGAFNLGKTRLRQHMTLLEHHLLGDITEGHGYQQYIVRLWDRDPGGNPWIEMLEFCEQTGITIDSLLYDLNFAQYDG